MVKARYKLKGPVNVSEFHVDPGWSGRLIFTVFNAGPSTIHLECRLPVFLLWIADLDQASIRRESRAGHVGIPPILDNITGVFDSIYAPEKRIGEDITKVANKQEEFRKEVAELKERQTTILLQFAIAAVLGCAVVGAGVKMLGDRPFASTSAAAVAPLAEAVGQANGQPPDAGERHCHRQRPGACGRRERCHIDTLPPGKGNGADAKGVAGE